MNWISQSFNISNFISSRSQVFDQLGVPKNFTRKIQMKKLVLKPVFSKLQASNVKLATFITKETSAQVGFFAKFLRMLFHRTAPGGCLYNFSVAKVQFIVNFPINFVTFQILYQNQLI